MPTSPQNFTTFAFKGLLKHLLLEQPHVGHLSLVVVMQPSQLLAGLLDVVVLPDQLDVVLSHHLQLLLQLRVLPHQTAVQRTGGDATEITTHQPRSSCRSTQKQRWPLLLSHMSAHLQIYGVYEYLWDFIYVKQS